jgi:diguanylate cyclase (GGDEF)-like protein
MSPEHAIHALQSGPLGKCQRQAIARLIATLLTHMHRDALTGLLNYAGGCEQLHQAVAQAWRYHTPLSLLMLDLDHFGQLNKRLGHVVVNQLLVRFSALLRHTRAGDIAVRFGGDEFVLILPQTDLTAATTLAERLRHAVTTLPLPAGAPYTHLTCSIGVAQYRIPEAADTFLTRADAALRRAKAQRDRVEVAEPIRSSDVQAVSEPPDTLDPHALVEVDRHVYQWDGTTYVLVEECSALGR